jgi:asparagine synthase (glutamine-hydrolysing)
MCRIAGIVNGAQLSIPELQGAVTKMTQVMAHGGPDGDGLFLDEEAPICLGHRRLALLDLSPLGKQPMQVNNGNYWITFNGEIYNFLEIRRELKQAGCSFTSHSDTEVILEAYRIWGEKAFEKLNGMFAFGLYDKPKKAFYLVRDYMGIKPLYYHVRDNQMLVFASEVKAFDASGLSFATDSAWKIRFLAYGSIPEPYTTLDKVQVLPPGHFLKWNLVNQQWSVHSFYQFNFSNRIGDKATALAGVRERLTSAVKRHLISDAPIGVFLSGGIDSSLLALIATQFQGENLCTLSAIFQESAYSERPFQEVVVKKLTGHHTYHTITQQDFETNIAALTQAMDQPSADGINSWFIARCARQEGLKAVLSGLGADELWGGYPSFARMKKLLLLNQLPAGLFKGSEWFKNDKVRKFSFLQIPDDIRNYLFLRGLFTPHAIANLLDISASEVLETLAEPGLGNTLHGLSPGNQASWLETHIYMRNQLLKDADYMSMAHGIEVRVPFLDKEVVELALQTSAPVKFNGSKPKELLVDAFHDILPRAVWDRPKMGFTFPFQKWLKHHPALQDLLRSPRTFDRKMAQAFQQDQLHWSRLWSLMIIRSWEKPR